MVKVFILKHLFELFFCKKILQQKHELLQIVYRFNLLFTNAITRGIITDSIKNSNVYKKADFEVKRIRVKNMADSNNNFSGKKSKFAAVLSQLRKERGSSQKKAAADLGISQALLSHYEKGIRECGLDFVIKCSEYYGVTTDYLLGISKSRYGLDEDYLTRIAGYDGDDSSLATLTQSTKILIDMAVASSKDNSFVKYLHDYYMLCIYRGALTLAKAGALPSDMFRLDYNLGHELASAAIAVLDSRFAFIEDKSRTGIDSMDGNVLHKLIEEAEEYIMSSFITE